MSNLWIVRHSERLQHVDKEKWNKSKRKQTNFNDDPITKNGIQIARKCALKLINDEPELEKYKYIYSSPMTRCIQTAIILASKINKLKRLSLKIRIEYGLVDNISKADIPFPIFKNGNLEHATTFIAIDEQIEIQNIIKRFDKYKKYFDVSYKSIQTLEEAKIIHFDPIIQCNRKYNVFDTIAKMDSNAICCTHGEVVVPILARTFPVGEAEKEFGKFVSKNYCASMKIQIDGETYRIIRGIEIPF